MQIQDNSQQQKIKATIPTHNKQGFKNNKKAEYIEVELIGDN